MWYNMGNWLCIVIRQELFDNGYIDTAKPAIFGNILGNIRFSNYIPGEEVGEIIISLRQYYDVAYTDSFNLGSDKNYCFYRHNWIDKSCYYLWYIKRDCLFNICFTVYKKWNFYAL